MLPETFLSDSYDAQWKCNKCKVETSALTVNSLLEETGRKLQAMEKESSRACKAFISEAESKLHPNHYYITDVKLALAQLIGQEFEGGLPKVSDEDLELKATICKKLEEMIAILSPGTSTVYKNYSRNNWYISAEKRVRGLLLFELHATVTEMGRRTASSGEGPEVLHAALIVSVFCLVLPIRAVFVKHTL